MERCTVNVLTYGYGPGDRSVYPCNQPAGDDGLCASHRTERDRIAADVMAKIAAREAKREARQRARDLSAAAVRNVIDAEHLKFAEPLRVLNDGAIRVCREDFEMLVSLAAVGLSFEITRGRGPYDRFAGIDAASKEAAETLAKGRKA